MTILLQCLNLCILRKTVTALFITVSHTSEIYICKFLPQIAFSHVRFYHGYKHFETTFIPKIHTQLHILHLLVNCTHIQRSIVMTMLFPCLQLRRTAAPRRHSGLSCSRCAVIGRLTCTCCCHVITSQPISAGRLSPHSQKLVSLILLIRYVFL